jgi:hypothetical protein
MKDYNIKNFIRKHTSNPRYAPEIAPAILAIVSVSPPNRIANLLIKIKIQG